MATSKSKTDLDLPEIARLLGMKYADEKQQRGGKRNEILEVNDSPAGTVVRTVDGQTYIIVPEDRPDAEGKTGVMWLHAPPRVIGGQLEPYKGTFPVFAQPGVSPSGDVEVEAG
jgi:hypothetical protein